MYINKIFSRIGLNKGKQTLNSRTFANNLKIETLSKTNKKGYSITETTVSYANSPFPFLKRVKTISRKNRNITIEKKYQKKAISYKRDDIFWMEENYKLKKYYNKHHALYKKFYTADFPEQNKKIEVIQQGSKKVKPSVSKVSYKETLSKNPSTEKDVNSHIIVSFPYLVQELKPMERPNIPKEGSILLYMVKRYHQRMAECNQNIQQRVHTYAPSVGELVRKSVQESYAKKQELKKDGPLLSTMMRRIFSKNFDTTVKIYKNGKLFEVLENIKGEAKINGERTIYNNIEALNSIKLDLGDPAKAPRIKDDKPAIDRALEHFD